MSDFERMAELLAARQNVQAKIRSLEDELSHIDSDIRSVAARIASGHDRAVVNTGGPGRRPPFGGTTGVQQMLTGSDDSDTDDDGAPLQPRQLRLLRLVRDNPEQDFGFFCIQMYESDDRSYRNQLSAYFSKLKRGGYVVPTGMGKFALTAKGVQAANAP